MVLLGSLLPRSSAQPERSATCPHLWSSGGRVLNPGRRRARGGRELQGGAGGAGRGGALQPAWSPELRGPRAGGPGGGGGAQSGAARGGRLAATGPGRRLAAGTGLEPGRRLTRGGRRRAGRRAEETCGGAGLGWGRRGAGGSKVPPALGGGGGGGDRELEREEREEEEGGSGCGTLGQ
eukprot:XP_008760097.1 PREDICTED: acanthoscurrin-1 isoform X1 [Rattus norvegicus]